MTGLFPFTTSVTNRDKVLPPITIGIREDASQYCRKATCHVSGGSPRRSAFHQVVLKRGAHPEPATAQHRYVIQPEDGSAWELARHHAVMAAFYTGLFGTLPSLPHLQDVHASQV